jgi:PadR family transcriptional regulator, regulatory protein PadR
MPLLKGTLNTLVLKALSWGPMHAFEISRWLQERSGGEFTIEEPALLQALHRLEERRLLAADWGTTENNRRARYYRMTAAGREELRAESESIRSSVSALTTILNTR